MNKICWMKESSSFVINETEACISKHYCACPDILLNILKCWVFFVECDLRRGGGVIVETLILLKDVYPDNFAPVILRLYWFYYIECQKGYMRDAESGDCVECPKGTYSDMEDAASCTSCPEGTDTPFNASPDVKYCIGKKLIFLDYDNSCRSDSKYYNCRK